MKNMKKLFSAIMALAILMSFSGCEDTYYYADRTPSTIYNESLAGRPPWTFPAEMNDDDRIGEMKAHLEGIVARKPNTNVLAFIYLDHSITVEEYVSILQTYNLNLGNDDDADAIKSSVHICNTQGCLGMELNESMSTVEELKAAILAYDPNYGNTSELKVESVSIWGTPKNLLKLWNENSAVRTIGIGGTVPNSFAQWNTVRPGEPIR